MRIDIVGVIIIFGSAVYVNNYYKNDLVSVLVFGKSRRIKFIVKNGVWFVSMGLFWLLGSKIGWPGFSCEQICVVGGFII